MKILGGIALFATSEQRDETDGLGQTGADGVYLDAAILEY